MSGNLRKRKAQSHADPDPNRPVNLLNPDPNRRFNILGRIIEEARKKDLSNKKRRTSSGPKRFNIIFQLKSKGITVHEPGEVEYERAVAVSNLLYRFTRPICVVQPFTATEVQKVVISALKSTTNTGVLLDLAKLNKAHLDMEAEILTVGGGALWGNAYKTLINGRHDGWAINGGRCPTVGVSGFMLGGGIGPFSRGLGMGCDTLTEITIVTADGELVTVSERDDTESKEGMLFWALRGGGGGNFGVAVEMKMRVLKLLAEDGMVTAGRYTWFSSPKHGYRELLQTMNRFYTTNWSDQMTIDSTWYSDTQESQGEIGVRFLVYFDGNEHDFGKQIQKAALDKGLEKQLGRRVLQEKSTRFYHETLVAQWDEETVRAFPSNSTFRLYSSFCFGNNSDTFTTVTTVVKEELEAFKRLFKGETNCQCQVSFIHSGGVASRKGRDATAFRWRETVYHAYIMMVWRDKWLERDMRAFLGKFKDRLKPLSITKQAAFVAFPDASLADDTYEKAYYGENRIKLQQVKRLWDKGNFFNWDQAIKLPRKGGSRRIMEAERITKHYESEFSDGESVDYEDMTDRLAAKRWDNEFDPAPCEWLTTGGPEGGGPWLYGGPSGSGARLL
ncbi:hypothetical protein CHU98_g9564 [Xylaria longipes]|nr:hypothetical protein CHU98_g9564 [Xylaria longipes]